LRVVVLVVLAIVAVISSRSVQYVLFYEYSYDISVLNKLNIDSMNDLFCLHNI